LSSRRTGRYEFGSPTFIRLDAESPPSVAAAAAAAVTDTSIQVQQQPTQAFSPLQQQVAMAQSNQSAAPPNPIHAEADAITGLLSMPNIVQHQRSSQPSIPSQRPSRT
jgi:hypothetical protein